MKNKKLKKWLSFIGAAAMSVCLLAGGAVNVQAEDAKKDLNETFDLRITKEVSVPKGTLGPEETFEFVFTALGREDANMNGTVETNSTEGMPGIKTATIEFEGDEKGSDSNIVEIESEENVLIKNGTSSVLEGKDFPHAGVFVYSLVEKNNSSSSINDINYSKSVYRVKIYVKNNTEMNGLVIAGYTVNKDANDAGETFNQKVDGAPGANNGVRFVNGFFSTTNLVVETKAAGDYASLKQEFKTKITFNMPESFKDLKDYKITYEVNGVEHSDKLEVDNGQATLTIDNIHGDTIKFLNVPVGSTYKVEQTGVAGYKTKAAVKGNGISGDSTETGTDANHTITLDGESNLLLDAEYNSVTNKATITNTYQDISITGKYSIQETTQGNGLTGAKPVRFSK
ncbi:MAG: hypothetical protein ACK5LL_06990 [Suipraeoptans sp.]